MNEHMNITYRTILNGHDVIFNTANGGRIRQPRIGQYTGLSIIDCECNPKEFPAFQTVAFDSFHYKGKTRFALTIEDYNNIVNDSTTTIE
ncbi:MAG: hypothetical protein ACOC22_00855 [bacterium]